MQGIGATPTFNWAYHVVWKWFPNVKKWMVADEIVEKEAPAAAAVWKDPKSADPMFFDTSYGYKGYQKYVYDWASKTWELVLNIPNWK